MAIPASTPAPPPKLQPHRPYAAIAWLIRGTGVIVASLSIILLIVGFFMALGIAIRHPETEGWIKGLLILAPLIVFGILFLIGYSMYMTVDGTTLSYFVFIFSLAVAVTFFQFLPVEMPESLYNYIQTNLPSIHFGDWLGIAYRVTFAVIVFFVFYAMIEGFLHRAMGFVTPVRRERHRSGSNKKADPFDKTSQSKGRAT